jgi:hypothetical protein
VILTSINDVAYMYCGVVLEVHTKYFGGTFCLHLQDPNDYGEDEAKCKITWDMVT